MNRIRRGKDFKVIWSFFDCNGEPYNLGKDSLVLYVSNSFNTLEVTDFEVVDNKLIWPFKGRDQINLGDYTMKLVKNGAGGTMLIDEVDAFTLVQYTREESSCNCGNVKIEDVSITSELDIDTTPPPVDVDTELSDTSENAIANFVVTRALKTKADKSEITTPDWNTSQGKAGYIKGKSHYIYGAIPLPFEGWGKRIDENGDYIYSKHLGYDYYKGCIIYDSSYIEGNYIFFETQWKDLVPIVSADIRINYDSDDGDSVLEIKLYQEGDSEEFLANIINNALFAYGQEDFVVPIAKEFIPNTIARQESVDELREETTALWENLDHGTFPDLTAGDLAGRGESVPAEFGFRASGGKSIKDGRAYIKRIKGNSVVWNQKVKGLNRDLNGVTSNWDGYVATLNGICTTTWTQVAQDINVIKDHKYLVVGHVLTNPNGISFMINLLNNVSGGAQFNANTNFNWSIGVCSSSRVSGFGVAGFLAGTDFTGIQFRTMACDLTQMFGEGKEPTTFEEYEARKPIVEDEYAYNEGQAIHCNAEDIKSVGDNAWDEQWRNGLYAGATGLWGPNTINISNTNPIRILPNAEYYIKVNDESYFFWYDNEMRFIKYHYAGSPKVITSPPNAKYLNFYIGSSYGNTYKNDIIISLYHSGWKAEVDNVYKPYWQDILPLSIIRKYFPDGMKSADTAHDEIRFNKASGKLEAIQRFGGVDLGTLTWRYYENFGGFGGTSADFKPKEQFKAICAKYLYRGSYSLTQDKELGFLYYTNAFIKDSAYTDAESLKASLQGVMLYYELAEPIVTEITEDFRDYYQVADFGTEMSQSSVPSAAFSADIIYQFNAVDMIREHEMEINELQSIIATMQAQLTSLINK